jgi:F-type H+-transporting ATPase subunit delta
MRLWALNSNQPEPGPLDPSTGTARANIAQGLSGRYATALFDLAVEQKALDAVLASLDSLANGIDASDDLKALIASPMVSRAAAATGIKAIAEAMALDSLTSNFLGVLAQNRRLGALKAIISDVRALAAARRGEITAHVTSAHALTKTQQTALAKKLKAGLGRDVALDLSTDPAILGGLVVRVGSRMIDSSIRTRLDALGQALKG